MKALQEEKCCKLSVIIPVYDERLTIEEILRRVQGVDIDKEIVIVDDGSTDGTRELLQRLSETSKQGQETETSPQTGDRFRADRIKVLFQEKNLGKGAALRRGFAEACGQILVIQDADLELDPQDYCKLLEPIEQNRADVVFGSRFLDAPGQAVFSWHYLGNKFLTGLSNILTNLDLSDVWTCYKMFKRRALDGIELREDRFGFEPEITAKLAKKGYRICEVPVSYWRRDHTQGKKITWKDGIHGIWCTLRYNLFD